MHLVGDCDQRALTHVTRSSLTSATNILECSPVCHPGWPPYCYRQEIQCRPCRSGLHVSGATIATGGRASEDRHNTVTTFREKAQCPLHHWDWPSVTLSQVLSRRSHKADQQKIQDFEPGFSFLFLKNFGCARTLLWHMEFSSWSVGLVACPHET